MSNHEVASGERAKRVKSIASQPTAVGERFFRPDGSVHYLYDRPLLCSLCTQPHWWFVNRDGRTRCVHCDDMHLQLLARLRREAVAPAAVEVPVSGNAR